jgi:hypothetical protein
MFLVEILAEVGAGTHVPRNEVLFVVVETIVLLALRFRDPMPGIGHETVKIRCVVGEGQEKVKMGRTP